MFIIQLNVSLAFLLIPVICINDLLARPLTINLPTKQRERELIFFQDCNICQKSRIENWADFLIQMFSDLILNFNLLWNISTAASISSCSYCDIICYRRITLSRILLHSIILAYLKNTGEVNIYFSREIF